MILNDIFEYNLEKAASEELRYLMYLSRNDGWVMVGSDLYQFKIKDIVHTIEKRVGTSIYFDKKYQPLTSQDETVLKTKLSKVMGVNADVFDIDSNKSSCVFEGTDLSLNKCEKNFNNLAISSGNRNVRCNLHAEANNFDSYFGKRVQAETNINAKNDLFHEYKNLKNTAELEAKMQAFWFAAASGDWGMLKDLFISFPSFDINAQYRGKTIIQAIFDAQPEIDVPFRKAEDLEVQIPQYGLVVNVLVRHGLNKDTLLKLYQKHQSEQDNLWFFQRGNPLHTKLLAILKPELEELLNKEVVLPEDEDGADSYYWHV